MQSLVAIGSIPSMKDDSVIHLLRGTVKQVWPKENKVSNAGKSYTSQAFLVADPTTQAVTMVRMFDQVEITPQMVGSTVSLTPSEKGTGLTKTSFVRTSGDRAGQRDHSVKANGLAVVTVEGFNTSPLNAPVTGSGSALAELGDLYLDCLHEANRIVMQAPFPIMEPREVATTLFIECNRKGIKAAPKPVTSRTQPAPVTDSPPPAQPKTEPVKPEAKPVTDTAPPSAAKLAAQAVTRSGLPQMVDALKDVSEELVCEAVDLLMKDMIDSGEFKVTQLDAAFAKWQKLHPKNANHAMLANYNAFRDVVLAESPPAVTDEPPFVIEDEADEIIEADVDVE
jgi:hypothetical protein